MIQILTHLDWMIRGATECSSFRKTGWVFLWHIQEPLRGLPQRERTGMFVGDFGKNPKGYEGPVVWGWLDVFYFSPQKILFLKQLIISSHFFCLNTSKKYWKSSCCGSFEAGHPKWHQNSFSNLFGMVNALSFLDGSPRVAFGHFFEGSSEVLGISNTRNSVSSGYPNFEKRVQNMTAEHFWRHSRCLHSQWNTVSSIWYISSIKTRVKGKVGSFPEQRLVIKPNGEVKSAKCMLQL